MPIQIDEKKFRSELTRVFGDNGLSSLLSLERCDKLLFLTKRMLEENEKWHFVDVSPELKNSENALKTDYSSGDGIHLSPDAYYAMLYQVCRTYLGDNTDTTLPADNELTIE